MPTGPMPGPGLVPGTGRAEAEFLDTQTPLCYGKSRRRLSVKQGVRIGHGKKEEEGKEEGQEGRGVISGCLNANGTGHPVPFAFRGGDQAGKAAWA